MAVVKDAVPFAVDAHRVIYIHALNNSPILLYVGRRRVNDPFTSTLLRHTVHMI